MKKIFFCLLLSFSFSLFALSYGGLSDARELAEKGIIVNQSPATPQYGVFLGPDIQEASMYRISDTIIRQEVLGIAMKLRGVALPENYSCRSYYLDTPEWWVCRAAELSADNDIITRTNLHFRPHDTLTLGEALGITIKSLAIPLSNTSIVGISDNIPNWQKRIIRTIEEYQIILDVRDGNGRSIAFYNTLIGSGFDMSHRLTRGQFFQIVTALLDHQNAHNPTAYCTVYNDGCNDCSLTSGVPTCTKRACIWQGIPSCSECEAGYALENNRCVKQQTACVSEGGYAGGGYVKYPENMNDFQCCTGLTRAERKNGSILADAGHTCIRQGDNFCDSRYENTYNSSDCRVATAFDSSICQTYYDGCNSCTNSSGGAVCTEMYCFVNGPAYCTSYVSYTPKTQSTDSTFLAKVTSEMRKYASDLSCTINAQCQWSMVGNRACGGPSAAIPYSTKNIDQSLVTSKGTYITGAEKKFNEFYGVMSDCMYVQPPQELRCINSLCQ